MIMSTNIQCFFITPTNESDRYLRRFASVGEDKDVPLCPLGSYHNADVAIGRFPVLIDPPSGSLVQYEISPDVSMYSRDDRWPTHCPCGYKFQPEDDWQVNTERIYVSEQRPGQEFSLKQNKRQPGMMWNAWWFADQPAWTGSDGRSLVVVYPDGHDWMIDSRAKNCTMPDDSIHKCWVRHGEPPNITVDKNGLTCAAGAGSIQTPKWHGFLRNGYLVD
jgi:hypothetical protein